jgi:hypothetical protein
VEIKLNWQMVAVEGNETSPGSVLISEGLCYSVQLGRHGFQHG